jgi:hypothetical protein
MPLPFTPESHADREVRACADPQFRGGDAIPMVARDKHAHLWGCDSCGFALFQCTLLTARQELYL